MHGAAALAGVDWQGEPTPRRDGSPLPVSQATALSQDGDSSMFSSREGKDGTQKKTRENKSMGSLGTMGGAVSASSKHFISSASTEMFTPNKIIICLFF